MEGCPFTCINNWNPTTLRTLGNYALTNAQQTTCPCNSGSYPVNYVCTLCDIGFYCTGGTRTACSSGFTTASTGSTSSSQCNICDIGFYMSGSSCVQCLSGYITVSTGSTSADQCLYLCTSSAGVGCCQSRVLIASSVTSIGIL